MSDDATLCLRPLYSLNLQADALRLDRRPGRPELALIDFRVGLVLVDPDRRELRRIPLPEEILSDLGAHGLCFRSDGEALLLASDDPRALWQVELSDPARFRQLPDPPLRSLQDLRVWWTPEHLLVAGGKTPGLLVFDGEGWRRCEDDPLEDAEAWYRAMSAIPLLEATVVRNAPDTRHVEYVVRRGVGWAGWEGGRIEVPTEIVPVGTAYDGRRLWVASREEVVALEGDGRIVGRAAVPEGHRWLAIEAVVAPTPRIYALSERWSDPLDASLWCFEIGAA